MMTSTHDPQTQVPYLAQEKAARSIETPKPPEPEMIATPLETSDTKIKKNLYQLLEKLAASGHRFTSHRRDLSSAVGHGTNTPGLTFNEIKDRLRNGFPVVGLKGGVEISPGMYSIIIDADAPGAIEALEAEDLRLSKCLSTLGSKPGHLIGTTDRAVQKFAYDSPDGARAIDILGVGAMAVLPPSPHRKTGKLYTVRRDGEPFFIPADELLSILERVSKKMNYVKPGEKNVWDHFEIRRDDVCDKLKGRVNLFSFGLKPGLQSCPLPGHRNGDRHPSLSIRDDGTLFNCFSKHGGGDVVTWIMLRDNCDFKTAIAALAIEAGIEVDSYTRNTTNDFIKSNSKASFEGVAPQGFGKEESEVYIVDGTQGLEGFLAPVPKDFRFGHPLEGGPKPKGGLTAYTPNGLHSLCSEQQKWLLEDYIPEGYYTIFTGPTGCCKTFFLLDAAISMALGKTRAFTATEPKVILYLDAENGPSEMKRRLDGLTTDLTPDEKVLLEKNLRFVFFPDWMLDRDVSVESLIETTKTLGATVVIFDVIRRFISGDENKSETANSVKKALDRLIYEAGATPIAIHHHKKVGDKAVDDKEMSRGSSDFIGGVAVQNVLHEEPTDEEGSVLISLKQAKRRNGLRCQPRTFRLKGLAPDAVSLTNLGLTSQLLLDKNTATVNLSHWVEARTGEFSRKDAIKALESLKVSEATVDGALSALLETGMIRRVGKKGSGKYARGSAEFSFGGASDV